MKTPLTAILFLIFSGSLAQIQTTEEYAAMKALKDAAKSPFEKIQAPVHFLLVPKERINTVNDVTEADVLTLGHLFLAAKAVAEQMGVAETGYRLVVNSNRDAGQSEFHLHMHLLGGEFVGPMVHN